MKKNNISAYKINCTGCKACFNSCPCSVIEMKRIDGGFLAPQVLKNCIDCGNCVNSCPDINNIKKRNDIVPSAYAMVNDDTSALKLSSSGGIFLKTANYVINELNGVVFGAAYCENFNVKIIKAECENDLTRLAGSKYIYADTGNSYREVEQYLKLGQTVLYSGVSCQIAALLCYLKKDYDNLICVEILCHGAPSQDLFNKYISTIEKKRSQKLRAINQRDKSKPWNPLITKLVRLDFEDSKCTVRSEDFDPYMSLYIRELAYRDSCYACKYVGTERCGDIIIGDFGGLGTLKECKLDTSNGVSLVIVNSAKGEKLINSIDGIRYEKRELTEAIALNSCLSRNIKIPSSHRIFIDDFEKMSSKELFNKYYYKNYPYLLRAIVKKAAFALLGHKTVSKFLLHNKK